MFLGIYTNNTLVASLYSHSNSDYATAGNAAIVYLRVGDTVQVKTKGTYPVNLYGSFDTNTFTGVELGSEQLCNYFRFVYDDRNFDVELYTCITHNVNIATFVQIETR